MNQMIVECSEPGWVITLSEELESILRHITFERAREIAKQLADLAMGMGPDYERAWQGFRIEVPNECGARPLSFGNREEADQAVLRELVNQADQKGIGKFDLWQTNLMDQSGSPPETREQYVKDLAETITYQGLSSSVEEEVIGRSDGLPASMSEFRKKLMWEYAGDIFEYRAKEPETGHRWIDGTADKLKEMLKEINTRCEAVMEYELDRLDPSELGFRERIRWAVLSARLGKNIEKWMKAADDSCAYLYQKAALINMIWNTCRGFGRARPLMESRIREIIGQAKDVYTPEGVDALRQVRKELARSGRWFFDKQEDENEDDSADE